MSQPHQAKTIERSVIETVKENLGRAGAHVELLEFRNLAVTLSDGRRCLIEVDAFEECPECGESPRELAPTPRGPMCDDCIGNGRAEG